MRLFSLGALILVALVVLAGCTQTTPPPSPAPLQPTLTPSPPEPSSTPTPKIPSRLFSTHVGYGVQDGTVVPLAREARLVSGDMWLTDVGMEVRYTLDYQPVENLGEFLACVDSMVREEAMSAISTWAGVHSHLDLNDERETMARWVTSSVRDSVASWLPVTIQGSSITWLNLPPEVTGEHYPNVVGDSGERGRPGDRGFASLAGLPCATSSPQPLVRMLVQPATYVSAAGEQFALGISVHYRIVDNDDYQANRLSGATYVGIQTSTQRSLQKFVGALERRDRLIGGTVDATDQGLVVTPISVDGLPSRTWIENGLLAPIQEEIDRGTPSGLRVTRVLITSVGFPVEQNVMSRMRAEIEATAQ